MKPRPGFLRDFCAKAEKLGFVWDGYCGSGHPRFRNVDTGATFTTSMTPSDWRSELNAISEMERMSGRKLERQNAARYRHHKVIPTDMRMSASERQTSEHVERLTDQAAQLRCRWTQLAAGTPDRNTATAARKVLGDYESIRIELERLHRTIPPITEG